MTNTRVAQPNADYLPGTWKGLRKADGTRSASFTCPQGHTMVLINHTISPDGHVSPSTVCPAPGCDFHAWLWLLGWRAL